MTTPNRVLRFTTWNVKGVNEALKAYRITNHLMELKSDIIFIQETHLLKTEVKKIKRNWIEYMYHSTFSSKARGVAILIRKNIPFICGRVTTDPNGRFIAVSGNLDGLPVILVSLYAPTWDDSNFFITLFFSLPEMETHYCILEVWDALCPFF